MTKRRNETETVANLMTREPCTCTRDDSLADAAHLLQKHDCGSLPVVDDDDPRSLVGMLTDRDICMCALREGKSLKRLKVKEAMSDEVVCCSVEDSVDGARLSMANARVRRMPVKGSDGRLAGLLTLAQVSRAAASGGSIDVSPEAVGHTLAKICEPV